MYAVLSAYVPRCEDARETSEKKERKKKCYTTIICWPNKQKNIFDSAGVPTEETLISMSVVLHNGSSGMKGKENEQEGVQGRRGRGNE